MELFLQKLKDLNISDRDFIDLTVMWTAIPNDEKLMWLDSHIAKGEDAMFLSKILVDPIWKQAEFNKNAIADAFFLLKEDKRRTITALELLQYMRTIC